MQPLTEIRQEARRLPRAAFAARHPEPVLLARATVEGDLQFADPGEDIAAPRQGSTMVHIPRMSAAERLATPHQADRRPVEPSWFPVRPPSAEPLVRVGRLRGNALRINDWTVSAAHAHLHVVPGTARASVEDLGSRNGTAHNGILLAPNRHSELLSGDELQFGRWVFVFLDANDFHRYLVGDLG